MAINEFTYQQLDRVLSQLGFTSQRVEARNRTWLYYEHAGSQTEIILIEKKPSELVHEANALSARRQLIERGLIEEDELDRMLAGPKEKSAPTS
jgi:hypothetical protein